MRSKSKLQILCSLFLLAVLSSQNTMGAELNCKEFEKAACLKEEKCSWVRAYKTSKGRDVSAFCRKKPVRKNSSRKINPAKKS